MQNTIVHSISHDVSCAADPADLPRLDINHLELDIIRDPAAIEAEWQTLAHLPHNSLCQCPAWCLDWWAAHGKAPLLVRGRLDGRTVMIVPLMSSRCFGLRIASFPGGRFNNLNTGLFDGAFPNLNTDERAMLFNKMAQSLNGLIDLLLLDTVPKSFAGRDNPLHGLGSVEHQDRSYQLPLLADMEQTLRQLNAKTRRKKYRNQYRRLEAAGGFEHICPHDAAGQHDLLDLFFHQKAERLNASGLPDVFRPQEIRTFLHKLVDHSIGQTDYPLRLHAIRMHGAHEGHVPAISALSRKGSYILCQFGSIDNTILKEASPGELLFWLMIEQSIKEGGTQFDFGLGDQPYKRSWCPQETVLYDTLLPITKAGRIALPAFVMGTRMKTGIKKNKALYGLIQKVRALA